MEMSRIRMAAMLTSIRGPMAINTNFSLCWFRLFTSNFLKTTKNAVPMIKSTTKSANKKLNPVKFARTKGSLTLPSKAFSAKPVTAKTIRAAAVKSPTAFLFRKRLVKNDKSINRKTIKGKYPGLKMKKSEITNRPH